MSVSVPIRALRPMPHDPLRLRAPAEADQYKAANYYGQSEAKIVPPESSDCFVMS